MAIDVGASCAIDTSSSSSNQTLVNQENSANATGTLDYLCVRASDNGAVDFASFSASGDNLTTNGVAAGLSTLTGLNEFNAPGDFTAFAINIGEYIGVFTGASGRIRYAASAFGIWYASGDQVPCSSQAFTDLASYSYALYATGTEAGGLSIPVAMHHILRH